MRATDQRTGANAGRRTPIAEGVEVLAALEVLALRDLRAQSERLRRALARAAEAPTVPPLVQGDLGRARTAAMDALELYSHAQGARAAAEQRARWQREEEDEVGDGDDRD